jgi:hypothetical protein
MTDRQNKTPQSPAPIRLKKLKQSALEAIAADLREEANRCKLTREELETAIKSRRSERKPDAA